MFICIMTTGKSVQPDEIYMYLRSNFCGNLLIHVGVIALYGSFFLLLLSKIVSYETAGQNSMKVDMIVP